MSLVLQFLLACLVTACIGALSAGFLGVICWAVGRARIQPELLFPVAGLVGLAMGGAGSFLGSRIAVLIGLLLSGWIGLVILAVPNLLAFKAWKAMRKLCFGG
jgi:hypothetical protein